MGKQLELGYLMTLEEFKESCKSKCLIDYDGSGNFSDSEGNISEEDKHIHVYPSAFLKNKYKTDKKHIVWYNR